jgi:hypothetical protein
MRARAGRHAATDHCTTHRCGEWIKQHLLVHSMHFAQGMVPFVCGTFWRAEKQKPLL